MNNQVVIPFGDKNLIVTINDWKDDMPKEIFVSIADKNDCVIQDVCMVREHYHYNPKSGKFEIDSNFVDCKVWADSNDEDYTDEFVIGVYEEEDE